MGMREGEAVDRGRGATQDKEFKVKPITADLVAQLAQQESRQAALEPDPLRDAPLAPYTIAPFDVLQVTVWAHPELTTPVSQFRPPEENGNLVGADGTIYYPYVGVLHVAGKTTAEVRALLTQALARQIPNPQVDVRIAAYRGKKVQVTGEVVTPSTMPLTDLPLRVQDAVALARGFTPDADLTNVTLTRDGKAYHLDLLAFYEGGDGSQNWLLRDLDVIHVGDRNRNRVFIMGEVKRQQAKLMVKRRMTLAEAIGDSEGLDPVAANPSRIYVIRGDYSAPEIFRLDASSADALLLATHFPLRPRDVVFVSTYDLTRWNRVISQIAPTVQMLYDAAFTYDVLTYPRTRIIQ
jgi:polysaccharide export outer membrane protein